MAVSSPEETVPGDNVQMEMALSYFEGLSADTYTGEVTLHDGTRKPSRFLLPEMMQAEPTIWQM